MKHLLGVCQPPLQHRQQINFGCKQGDSDQQHQHVAEKDDHGGKHIALAGDIRLLRPENRGGERYVKRIGRADQQMEPHEEVLPVPDEMTNQEDQHDQHRVEWEKIGRQ